MNSNDSTCILYNSSKLTQTQIKVLERIQYFINMRECPCCIRHSMRKPVDLNDRRAGYRFNEGDSRNITGTHEEMAYDERIDTLKDLYPRVLVFQNIPEECDCNCRKQMRTICRNIAY